MKTITIRDDVYNMLVAIKGKKSFSEVIEDLIRKDIKKRGKMIIEICNMFGKPEDLFIKILEEGVKVEDTAGYLLFDRIKKRK